MTGHLTHSPALGRNIRVGNWAALAEGTLPLIHRCLSGADSKDAAELAAFFLDEMRVVFDIYTQWFADTARYLQDKGLPQPEIDGAHDDIRHRLAPFHAAAGKPRTAIWAQIAADIACVADETLSISVRCRALDRSAETWRDLHDCEVDQLSGLFDLVIRRFGEPALREMYEGWVIGDWFAKRYQRFDVSNLDWTGASQLLVYLAFEGHHGHLSGPARDGSIEFVEDAEKITLSFRPCGSGGRTLAGEARDGLPPLADERLNWPPLGEAHDFTWNQTGICAYCAHCCLLHETLPIAAFGYPVRVTDPPRAPLTGESRCSWTIYKDLRAIPDEIYRRTGACKPAADLPLGSAGRAAREAQA